MKRRYPDIILVEPQHPGNVGFAARAMKTMGFGRMVIVSEKGIDEAGAMITATDAKDVLRKRKWVRSIRDILPGYQLLIAFTARKRSFRNSITLPELKGFLSGSRPGEKVGFVFGRESSGLSNEELGMCQCAVNIPTGKSFSSLNLSHAIQVACYEFIRPSSSRNHPLPGTLEAKGAKATAMEREAIFAKLEMAGKRILLNDRDLGKISRIFRILLEERPLSKREAGGIHRFLDQVIHH